MGSISLGDPLELVSFFLMLYTAAIALYITWRAFRVGIPYLILSLFLSLMVLLHGIHHFFAFIEDRSLEQVFEFGASAFALALAVVYAFVWRHS